MRNFICSLESQLFGLVLAIFIGLIPLSALGSQYTLGVFYFPGWKDNAIGLAYSVPWAPIQNGFSEREPLAGWYQEGNTSLMQSQLNQMESAGINYVIFDWLWGRDSKGYLEHAIKSYQALPEGKNVKYSILWANHTDYIFSLTQLKSMVNYWCKNFFISKDYQYFNGKPIVYIFSATTLNNNIQQLGLTNKDFFTIADEIAATYNLPGISFIGGSWANNSALDYTTNSGYAAFSSYNLQSPATFKLANSSDNNSSRNYADLDLSYQDHWNWMKKNSTSKYIVPVSAGWDKRPWGGSTDPLHDNSIGTVTEFISHLTAAKKFMIDNPILTDNNAVICCWNEYGEGSIIEPTVGRGTEMLEAVHSVFTE